VRLYNNRVLETILNFAIFVAALSYATFESSTNIFINGQCIRCTDFNCETFQTKGKWLQRYRGSCIRPLSELPFRSIRVKHMYRLLPVLSYFILPLLMTSLIITIQIMIMNRSRDSWTSGCGTANRRKIRRVWRPISFGLWIPESPTIWKSAFTFGNLLFINFNARMSYSTGQLYLGHFSIRLESSHCFVWVGLPLGLRLLECPLISCWKVI